MTMCIFVPTQWDQVTAIAQRTRLRVAMWGAAPASQQTLEALARTYPGVDIVSAYGQTEMSGATTLLKGPDSTRKMGSVGRPMRDVELRLAEQNADGVGEIVYRGPFVMRGYWNNPEATAEAFAGGWFHSGDLATRDDEGYLRLVDRKKDMIVSGGENIYPAEVERVLREHPAVEDVAVVGVPAPTLGRDPGGLRGRRVLGRRVDRALPPAPGGLQEAHRRALRHRAAAQRGGQGAQARAARPQAARESTSQTTTESKPRSRMRLNGRIMAVTGGGSGIGAAICRRLAEEGATVAALDIQLDAAQATIDALGSGVAVHADVSDSAAVEQALAHVERELGPLDAMINNAGAVGGAHLKRVTPLLEQQRLEALEGEVTTPLDALVRITDDEWRQLLSVHLDGTFFCTRAAARLMAARGHGVIVNMSSVCGLEGCTGHPHYSAAKAGILGFTKSAAKELIVQGIRVNAVAPGHVNTSKLRDSLDAARRVIAANTPAGRLAQPEEIAATVAFLVSDDASYYVGATLSPNGGLVTAV